MARAGKPRQTPVGPAWRVKALDGSAQQVEPRVPFRRAQLERLFEPVGHALQLPRVDEQSAGQALRGPRELAQQQDAAGVRRRPGRQRLAEHELLPDEVHAIPERRHRHHVGAAVESDELSGRDSTCSSSVVAARAGSRSRKRSKARSFCGTPLV